MPSPIKTSSTHASTTPSEWLQRFIHLLPPHSQVLDVACGSGRHAAWLQSLGHHVTGIDRDTAALEHLPASVRKIVADIERAAWPLPGIQFDAVVVTNYLWRALWPKILASVRPGGFLLYETFAQGNEAYGKPSRPDFLLRSGELLHVCANWHIVAYEHGLREKPQCRVIQRIVAVAPDTSPTALPRLERLP